MNLAVELFATMLTSLSRGRDNHGNLSLAKPIYVLSLLEYYPFMERNEIPYSPNLLMNFYKSNMDYWQVEFQSPILNPFFHLHSESFYELVWKDESKLPKRLRTPTAKFLRENLEYAKLDDDLWEILQDPDNREYLRQAIIAKYLKK